MRFCGSLVAIAIVCLSAPAHALVIDFSTIAGDSLTSQQATAFNVAAEAWESVLTDPVTLNIQIGFQDLGSDSFGSLIGETEPNYMFYNYGDASTPGSFVYMLTHDATSALDEQAVSNLPQTVPTDSVTLTSANAKALGFAAPYPDDGSIEFSTEDNFQYSRNPDGTIDSNNIDFLGTAEHEIGHILGFDSFSGVLYGTPGHIISVFPSTSLDLFRYSSPGVLSNQYGASAYFSVDGGVTDIANFSTGLNAQESHWAPGSPYLMTPYLADGHTLNITPTDLEAFDAIGWDVTTVPEPESLALLVVGVVALCMTRRQSFAVGQRRPRLPARP